MRVLTGVKALSAVAGIVLLAGCAGIRSSIAPTRVSPQNGTRSAARPIPAVAQRLALLKANLKNARHFTSFDACPATGPLRYVSDDTNNVVNIYTGKFAGQAPCGQISSGLFNFPYGLYVKNDTHDLYVANVGNVLVFHRGQTTPYNAYVDPSNQVPNDVTVAKDGTIIASNLGQYGGPEAGSISTWIPGPNGGTFVGNYPMTNDSQGGFLTVQKNGTVYFDDQDSSNSHGSIWSLSCPAGVCGTQTQLAGASLGYPGGMGSDSAEDLLVTDEGLSTADTFELPNPTPTTFKLGGIPIGMAIGVLDNHWFVADALNNDAAEYSYPSGVLIGTVPGSSGGNAVGIALDPGHAR